MMMEWDGGDPSVDRNTSHGYTAVAMGRVTGPAVGASNYVLMWFGREPQTNTAPPTSIGVRIYHQASIIGCMCSSYCSLVCVCTYSRKRGGERERSSTVGDLKQGNNVAKNSFLSRLKFENRGVPGLLDGLGLGASCPSGQHGDRCASTGVNPTFS